MKIRNQAIIRSSAIATALTIKTLFRTIRSELHLEAGINPYDPPANRRFIWSVWHDSVVMPVFGRPQVRTSALVSLHRDGTFVEHLLHRVNMPVIRGSSGRGGAAALRTLLKVSESRDIVVTPDGPRGPRRELKTGIVYLASRSGNAIVPTGFAASRCWRIHGSWTDQVIPQPFSRVILLVGQPITIPQENSRDALRHYTELIQADMRRLDAKASRLVTGRRPYQAAPYHSPRQATAAA
jgi:lysophospholipid acyltransferase (LPLAT)-like uncharacterized protein